MYTMVVTEWWDGKSTTHFQFTGWASYTCSGGSGTVTSPPPPQGPGTSSWSVRLVDNLQQQYEDRDCEVPTDQMFVNSTMYDASPAANYTFQQLAGGNVYAILSEELKFGLDQFVNVLDRVPVVSSAYRTPSTNSSLVGSATCSSHTYGRAADFSIRDPFANDDFSCTMWNELNAAAQLLNYFVEDWDDVIAGGGVPHFHVDFTRQWNNPVPCTGYP